MFSKSSWQGIFNASSRAESMFPSRDRLGLKAPSMRYFFGIALFLTFSGISFGQANRAGKPKPVDDAALRNAGKSPSDGDWLSYGLTPGETRFSPLKLIDASNVKRLGLVW